MIALLGVCPGARQGRELRAQAPRTPRPRLDPTSAATPAALGLRTTPARNGGEARRGAISCRPGTGPMRFGFQSRVWTFDNLLRPQGTVWVLYLVLGAPIAAHKTRRRQID